MPNILYITHYSPKRHDLGGGGVRTRLIWEALKKIGNVYVVTRDENAGNLDSHFATYHVRHQYIREMFEGKLWRLTGKYGYMVINPCYTPMPLDQWFPKVHFDFAVGRYFNAFNDVRPWKNNIQTYVDIDDHPMELLKKVSIPDGYLKRLLAMKLQLYYLEHHLTGGWITKETDRLLLRKPKNYSVLRNIPPEIPSNYASDCHERKNVLVTIALFSYSPNRDGVAFFLSKIWPSIKSRFPSMEYWIVGKGLSSDEKHKWSMLPGVRIWGFVENLNCIYEQCLAVVVPILTGAGSCIKTIEALAYSRIVLSTHCGARGYENYAHRVSSVDASNLNEPILIYEDEQDFISALTSIVLNKSKVKFLEKLGRQIINDYFTFDNFCETIKERFNLGHDI